MRKHIVALLGKSFPVPTRGVALLMVMLVTASHLQGADFDAKAPATVRIWLSRSKEHKFLLRATAPGGPAWLALDTGAPVTCADESKTALFKFQPFPARMQPPMLIMNGQQAKMTLIPQMDFAGLTLKNIPAVFVDLTSMNQLQQRNGERGPLGDCILGLDALCRLHAVIDCGAGKIFLHPATPRESAPSGWRAVPMRLVGQHLIVPVVLNDFHAAFMVDTGSPASIIDSALCFNQRIPVGDPNLPIEAIHHKITAALATISDVQIGSVDLGQTHVAVFDFNTLTGADGKTSGAALPFNGLIGAQTLERLKAIIDCNTMQLYIRQPGRGGWWGL